MRVIFMKYFVFEIVSVSEQLCEFTKQYESGYKIIISTLKLKFINHFNLISS